MPDPSVFQIEDGLLAFALVDKQASGYLDSWQAPGGKTLATVTMADYEADAVTSNWSCQVTSGMITPSPNTNDRQVPSTFCVNGRTIPQPTATSYTLDVEFLQQVAIDTGLDAYLFANDTLEAYYVLGLNGEGATTINAPKSIGRCVLIASAFGGAARDNLTATISLQLVRKDDRAYGSGATVTMIEGFTPPPQPVGAE